MADKKRKSQRREKLVKKKKSREENSNKIRGPRLPSAIRKQLDNFQNPNFYHNNVNGDIDDDDEVIDSDEGEFNDLYEYEEEVAEEESKKNRRYDPVDNYEYQLPEKFEDEDVASDDDDKNDDMEDGVEDDEDSGDDEEDDEKHARMLQEITGIPSLAFKGKKRKGSAVVSEAYPESEFNPSRDVLSGDGQISIQDLLDPLRGTSDYSKLRKRIHHVEKGASVHAPLPKPERERVERGAAYEYTKKDITRWEHLVKRNREAPTLYFDQNIDLGFSTVGAIASEFKPRTDFEKAMASLVHDNKVVEACKNDGAKLLELNKISVEEVKDRQARLAKMRSLLFRHEMKAKHVKKIKSKTYHRLKKKERLKASSLDLQRDPEAARELAEKQERKRAEARMTLRHKNQGKWAKRVLERGLDKQDEGTRAAISEQLHLHNLLTRKMNTMKDSSSSDDSSHEDDDDDLDSSDEEAASKLLAKAKEKTINLMEQDDEVPDSGVLSLPFMVRGLEKRKEAASEEAKLALEEYELSLKQQDKNVAKRPTDGTLSGRRVFGASAQKQVEEPNVRHRPDIDNYGSESEDIIEEIDKVDMGCGKGNEKDVSIDLDVLREGLETRPDSLFKSIDHVVEDPGPRTTYDVSVFASGSWKKMKREDKGDHTSGINSKNHSEVAEPSPSNQEVDEDSDTDSGGQMIDGMLSSGTKQTYELPTNEELIRRAFAGDDVEEEFAKDKEEVLNEENPEPEKPLQLPGWGQWTNVQKKRGLPKWMLEEHASAKQKRQEALDKRKDKSLGHVIISEKVDKKAEKLYAKTLPYPFTSKEAFEQSIRMPLGPEFNPASASGALTRPDVVKKPGVNIAPIKYEDVDPHEKGEEQKQGGRRQKVKGKKGKSRNSKKT